MFYTLDVLDGVNPVMLNLADVLQMFYMVDVLDWVDNVMPVAVDVFRCSRQ